MATPIAVAIPLLRKGQTIQVMATLFHRNSINSNWVGRGRKSSYKTTARIREEGQTRGESCSEGTQIGHYSCCHRISKRTTRPDKDIFAAAERFRTMIRPPGELARLLVRYPDEAIQAELRPKQACVFFITQMPHEIQAKLKEWIRKQGAEVSEDNAMKMTGEIKRGLLLKDIPLDKGFRGVPVGRVASVNTSRKDSERESQESEDERDTDKVRSKERQDWNRRQASFEEERDVNFIQSRRTNLSERRVTTSRGQKAVCNGCGKPGHLIKNCPECRHGDGQRFVNRENRYPSRGHQR